MLPFHVLLLLGLLALPSAAQNRTWRNADSSSSFVGEYLSHDGKRVTIRRQDGRVFTFEIDKLHEADRSWLKTQKPPEGAAADVEINPNAVFDTLCFGDNRKEVEQKLKDSTMVETALDETFFGRFGLNGTFRTKQQIGGLHCELYFDWTENGGLSEISLQTESLGADSYGGKLHENWQELSKVLTLLHGKPLQTADFPDRSELQNDLFLASHIWRLDGGGSALLGTSMQGGKYQVVVRFTTENIQPVRVP
ncbi:hypothetical protein HAHE_30140 [Haloferula helveola]|uniref:SLA1 homology domain-containing protein n=1 Tax=Haloferula helveola TaxID=490095 RepID=A0ABM7RBT8_9BACT|nr:hypothetical protein HAHE_30140 [Haloferula helveola]